jgi:FAD/FMN-containing dehydrogenase
MALEGLRREFVALLGEGGVLWERTQVRTYECDGLTGYRAMPGLVVLPTTTAQVAAIVRACARQGTVACCATTPPTPSGRGRSRQRRAM